MIENTKMKLDSVSVLIVDDSVVGLKLYEQVIGKAFPNWRILTASSFEIARNTIEENKLQIVITDLCLSQEESNREGLEVLKLARDKDPETIVIISTVYEDRLDFDEAFRLGAYDWLNKFTKGGSSKNNKNKEIIFKLKNALSYRETIIKTTKSKIEESLNEELQKFFDPLVYQYYINEKKSLIIKEKNVTIVFWDVRGFSKLCKQLNKHTNLIFNFLNDFFNSAQVAINNRRGIVDKFLGDGIMAIFGALDNDSDGDVCIAAHSAIDTSLEMREIFSELYKKHQPKWEKLAVDDIEIGLGCGINSGEAFLGISTNSVRVHYTAIGENVNVAARIQGHSKDKEILVSQRTWHEIKDSYDTVKKKIKIKIDKEVLTSIPAYQIIDRKK